MLILRSYASELGPYLPGQTRRPRWPPAESTGVISLPLMGRTHCRVLVVGHRRRSRGILRWRGASERERGLENFPEGILRFSESSAVFCFSHRWVLESFESVAGGGGGVASQSFEEFWTMKVKRTGKWASGGHYRAEEENLVSAPGRGGGGGGTARQREEKGEWRSVSERRRSSSPREVTGRLFWCWIAGGRGGEEQEKNIEDRFRSLPWIAATLFWGGVA